MLDAVLMTSRRGVAWCGRARAAKGTKGSSSLFVPWLTLLLPALRPGDL